MSRKRTKDCDGELSGTNSVAVVAVRSTVCMDVLISIMLISVVVELSVVGPSKGGSSIDE
jgi:hypothetical protein